MKQVRQSLKTGTTEVTDIPCPNAGPGQLLINTHASLVSAGTERMLVEFSKAGWIEKARQQPDKLRMVWDKILTDGLLPAIAAVRNKLDQPLAMGYCNAGEVVEVGAGVTEFSVGDRVASNGKHAEIVTVPARLCARVPDGVSDEAAAFTVVGAIALQGIRLAQPTLGETVVVTGLGLVGLMTVQLLKAQGCRVLGADFDATRLALARRFGAETVDLTTGEDAVAAAKRFSRGRGVDAVIVATSTKSNEPVHHAAEMCRKRGRIVLVGVAGLELSRTDFYEKELTFQVSCSYGPGRYDPEYEEKGRDYPIGFVRWTEQRNLEAVLDMMADGRLDVARLISHRFPIEQAEKAYKLISSDEPSLGVLFEYASEPASAAHLRDRTINLPGSIARTGAGKPVVAFIGAGNYATQVLVPAFRDAGVRFRTVVSSGGVSATNAARKFGFAQSSTDAAAVLGDPEINVTVIATRHDSHAQYTSAALKAGKRVFVEKPLALNETELVEIEAAYGANVQQAHSVPILMVGFNRRFAPHVRKIKELIGTLREPKTFIITVNAGAIPVEHWAQDSELGGGRILGEVCHFIDLLRFLSGSPIAGHRVEVLRDAGSSRKPADKVSLSLRFADGSIGTVHYFANGHRSFPKERIEVFCAGRVLQLDNFRKLRGFGWPGFRKMNLWSQDKGQRRCAKEFVNAVEHGGPSPIPYDELIEVARVTIKIAEAART